MEKLLFLTFFSLSYYAQAAVLNLQTAISELQNGSLTLKKSKSNYEEQSWKKVESYGLHLPTLTLSGTYLTEHKYLYTDMTLGGAPASVPAIIPTTNYYLTLTVPLFDGFSSTARTRSARLSESAAENEYQWEQFRTEKDLTLQFYKTLAAVALKDVAEQNLKTLTDHLQDIKKYKAAGISTNYDVLRVEVQVSEATAELMNAHDNIEINRNKLAELMGQQAEVRELQGTLPILKSDLAAGLKLESVQNRLDLKAFQLKTESAQEYSTSTGRYWVPRVNFFGQFQYYNNKNDQISDTASFRDAYQVGVMLNWALFDGMSSVAKSHEASEQMYQAEKSYQMTFLKAQHDFDFWKRRFAYFSSIYISREENIHKSEETVRLAKEGRKVGSMTNTDLLDAELEFFKAKAALVNSQLGAIESLIQLELNTNTRLYDFAKGNKL